MIQSVARAFKLVELLDAAEPEGLALSEIAALAELKAPTACNLLRTLMDLGYAMQDETTRRYRLGAKAWGHGRAQRLGDLLREVALGPATELRDAVNETVQVTVYHNQHRNTLLSVESNHQLRAAAQSGSDTHLYSTATGRVLLSGLDATRLAAHVTRFGPPGDAWPEAPTASAMTAALATIRAQGWTRLMKPDGHLHAQAAAIPTGTPDIVAAVGVYYPSMRWDAAAEEGLRPTLTASATTIGDAFAARH